MTTKEKIIYESLKLFSVHGFQSASVRTIAAQVGVSDGALYKHFKNKQAIFDAIVEESRQRILEQYKKCDIQSMTWEDMREFCMQMFAFQVENEWIAMFREMLVIEHFRNPEAAKDYKKFFIEMPIRGSAAVFSELIEQKIMRERDPEVMAMELYAPFFLYHTVIEDPEKLRTLFDKHVTYFIENNALQLDCCNEESDSQSQEDGL